MSNELFTDLPESNPDRLKKARLALEKAEQHLNELRESSPAWEDCPAPLKWDLTEAKKRLEDAENELRDAELEAMK